MSLVHKQSEFQVVDGLALDLPQQHLQFLYKGYPVPFINFDHFIYNYSILQKMTSDAKGNKDFEKTSDSFGPPSYQFNYHNAKGECHYQVALENQGKAIARLLQDGLPTKEQIERLFGQFQKQANQIISQLLTQTAEVRRKLRTQHDQYESLLRQKTSKIRKLVEENISLSSNWQVLSQTYNQNIKKQQSNAKKESTLIESVTKEKEGLQTLLAEYQKQLDQKDEEINEVQKEADKETALYDYVKGEMSNQRIQSQEIKEVNNQLMLALKNQEILLAMLEEKQIALVKQPLIEIQILTASDRQQKIKIEDLLNMNEKLKNDLEEEKQKGRQVEQTAKQQILKLKLSSEGSINHLKQKYEAKGLKVAELFQKQMKKAKSRRTEPKHEARETDCELSKKEKFPLPMIQLNGP